MCYRCFWVKHYDVCFLVKYWNWNSLCSLWPEAALSCSWGLKARIQGLIGFFYCIEQAWIIVIHFNFLFTSSSNMHFRRHLSWYKVDRTNFSPLFYTNLYFQARIQGGAPTARAPPFAKKKKGKKKEERRRKREREKTVPFSTLLLVSKLAMWQRLSYVAD